MAKKVSAYIKLQVPAGKANPSPPIGPALGQHGVNIMGFCKEFNAASGEFEPGMIERLPRNLFPDDVEVGMGFRMRNEAGQVLTVYVESVGDEVVEVNLSHPLAGKDLYFAVEIAEVREATEADLQQDSCDCGCGDECDDDCDCCS